MIFRAFKMKLKSPKKYKYFVTIASTTMTSFAHQKN